MEKNNNQNIVNSDWCYYLVAFLDVMGQKEVFNKLCPIKSCEEISDQLRGEISKNLFYLEKLRENIEMYFKIYTNDELSKIGVEESCRDQFDQMRKAEIHFQFISDSIIAFVPLIFKSFYSVTVNGAWGVLGACALAALGSLALEHAIRGGIEICWGTRIKNGNVYGPALNEAYRLESEVAQYPRIVIGDGMWDYLNSLSDKMRQHPDQTQIDIDACKGMADRCLKLLSRDSDGILILDYLGPGFLELNKSRPRYFEMSDLSNKFVLDSFEKYKKEGNSKLGLKYHLLNEYFQSRASLIEDARKSLPAE